MLSLSPAYKNLSLWSFAGRGSEEKIEMKALGLTVVLLAIGLVFAAGPPCFAQEPLCIFTVDPKLLYFEPEGGTQEVTVKPSSPGCSFTPRTAYRWITTSSSEDLGKKVVIIHVEAAPNLAQRVGAVMVGTTQIEVLQKARDHLNW